MKRLLNIAIILTIAATTWVGCSNEDTLMPADIASATDNGSTIHISMNLNIPDPVRVASRNGSVTEGINTMTVLCFNKNGEALSTRPATYSWNVSIHPTSISATNGPNVD